MQAQFCAEGVLVEVGELLQIHALASDGEPSKTSLPNAAVVQAYLMLNQLQLARSEVRLKSRTAVFLKLLEKHRRRQVIRKGGQQVDVIHHHDESMQANAVVV